jgi:hypothetical protein
VRLHELTYFLHKNETVPSVTHLFGLSKSTARSQHTERFDSRDLFESRCGVNDLKQGGGELREMMCEFLNKTTRHKSKLSVQFWQHF